MRLATVTALALLGLSAAMAHAQNPVPLGDNVDEPLLPAGIRRGEIELFGMRAYLFQDDAGANVVHVIGDFELHIGRQRHMAAQEAVVWILPRKYNDIEYVHLQVYLARAARVEEPGGTITTGPILMAAMNVAGALTISTGDYTKSPVQESAVYDEALRIRRVLERSDIVDVEQAPPMRVIDLVTAREAAGPKVRPNVQITANVETFDHDGMMLGTATGNIFVFREDPAGGPPLELRSDAAVLFFRSRDNATTASALAGGASDVVDRPVDLLDDAPGAASAGLGGGEFGTENVEAVYLEGDVVLTRGDRMIRAREMYYDLLRNRGLIINAVARIIEPSRNLPIYVRAAQVRQMSASEFEATRAQISTSEFYTPHASIGAREVKFTDLSSPGSVGGVPGLRAGTYEMRDTTFNLSGTPIAYWPYSRGEFERGESPIRGVRTGYSNDFGPTFETEWDLFGLAGTLPPDGFDAILRLDFYGERGPGAGVDIDYERPNDFGLLRSYYIHDDGRDNLGRFRDEVPDSENRSRLTLRHRQYLPDDWQLTLEASYITDRGFLEEYFENEFDAGKEQETLIYLKKQRDNWAFTLLGQPRILDFVTQTEHFPEVTFRLIGEPIGKSGAWYSENRAGFARYRPGDRETLEYVYIAPREPSSGMVARSDTRQELEFPFDVGPVRVVPFVAGRASAWDDSVDSGGLGRLFATAGARASMYFSRVYDNIHNQLLDINGIRHIIKTDATAWVGGSNRDVRDMYPFEYSVEEIDAVDGVSLGVLQRWQTRRGGPGRVRTVDLLTLDIEMGVFNDVTSPRERLRGGADFFRGQQRIFREITNGFASYSRPENSIAQNYINGALNWRINDSTVLLSEANIDLNDGELDVFNTSLVVERDPRLAYLFGYRFIEESNSSLLGIGGNYKMNEKYTLAVRESFDIQRGETEEFTIGVIRKFPRWYIGVTVDLNEADDDFGISMSAWPEGLPRTTLGSRRFTGLTQSTGIRPE